MVLRRNQKTELQSKFGPKAEDLYTVRGVPYVIYQFGNPNPPHLNRLEITCRNFKNCETTAFRTISISALNKKRPCDFPAGPFRFGTSSLGLGGGRSVGPFELRRFLLLNGLLLATIG